MTATQLSIRMDDSVREQIQQLIDRGEFSTVSEFVKYAIRVTLRDYSGRATTPPPLGPRTITAIAVD